MTVGDCPLFEREPCVVTAINGNRCTIVTDDMRTIERVHVGLLTVSAS